MKVKATYVFEFEPDTSDISSHKKEIAEDLARYELDDMLKNHQITSEDFAFEVIDDGNDHKITGAIASTLLEKGSSNKMDELPFRLKHIASAFKTLCEKR